MVFDVECVGKLGFAAGIAEEVSVAPGSDEREGKRHLHHRRRRHLSCH